MSYEIILIKKGSICFSINNQSYTANDNTLIFISCLEEHSITILSEQYERYYLNLSPQKLDRLLNDPKLCSVFKNRPIGFVHTFTAPSQAVSIMDVILGEYERKTVYSEELIVCRLKELLILMYREDKKRFPIPDRQMKTAVYDVQRHIENNYIQQISISALADEFYISKYYLTHSFKELTGYSPKQYLLLNRLSHAKELLINSDLSIGQIGIKSGFLDGNSFIRAFKNEFGVTPSVYKKK